MANEADGQRWAKELVERIGKSIKLARGGNSAAWLSDRTAELGYRVSPTVIAKLDSGHRGSVLSVAELIVLAAALNSSPTPLVFPGRLAEEVELLPGYFIQAFKAAQWFSALEWLPGLVLYDGRTYKRTALEARDDFQSATQEITAWRRLSELEASRNAAISHLQNDDGASQIIRDGLHAQIQLYNKLIHDLRRQLGLETESA
ncbi:hypothetical protein SAMN04488581_0391 [Mycolicibacterium neoaurum]|uniref:hypothetical protein n=1 Tax=Mycolicibacterium neoaurum TaxID=1795 RepID=UPI00068B469E|nr:hypothetical protein [Mycolicibacterium neoaurum]SDC25430.1 hypothetical protein SAMN04488581_0391 [Mycolicibacterium neoaurum]